MITIRTLAAAIIFCSLFTACKKHDWKGFIPIIDCRIMETDGRIMEYNSSGDPVSVKYKEDPDATGRPTLYFRYDAKKRLIFYGNGTDHYLTYNSKNQVVLDTMIQNYAGQDDRYERKLYYDDFGRIIKVIQKQYHTGSPDPDFPPVWVEEITLYKYDNKGNLVIPGVAYDNKTSIHRTNIVWMLINENYSLNNPVTSTTYNAQGLPRDYVGVFLNGFPTNGIIYNCEERKIK